MPAIEQQNYVSPFGGNSYSSGGVFHPGVQKFTSLVDVVDSRPDLQQAIRQGLNINDWWNQYGVKEYPGVTLVPPGDSRIQDPKTLTAEAQTGQRTNAVPPSNDPTSGFNPTEKALYDQLKGYVDQIQSRGQAINPNVTITPEKAAEFLKQAEGEINPYYQNQLSVARERLLQDFGYTKEEINAFERNLERQYGNQVRQLGEQSAEQGFAQSGIRNREESNLAQDTQESIDAARRQQTYRTQGLASDFAQRYGGGAIPQNMLSGYVQGAPRVLSGIGEFQRSGTLSPLYSLSPETYSNLIGSEEFSRRSATQQRASQLEGAFRNQQAINQQRTLTL